MKSASAASVPVTVCGPSTLVSSVDHVTPTGAEVPSTSTLTEVGSVGMVPRRTVVGTAPSATFHVPWPKPLSSQYEGVPAVAVARGVLGGGVVHLEAAVLADRQRQPQYVEFDSPSFQRSPM